MIYGLYNSAAGMMTNEYRQAVIANNLANAETVGFKRDIAVFSEREPAWLAGERHGPSNRDLQALSGGLWLGRTHTDFSEAAQIATGNPSDIALEGPGFLVVGTPEGPQYTRDGRLTMDRDGMLVSTVDGAPVLNAGGTPIQLDPYGGPPTVDTDGMVIQNGRPVAPLAIVDFPDYGALQKVGENRLAGPDDDVQPSAAYVHSGHLEHSGSEPVRELVQMIEASRAYQMNARMITLQDGTVGRLLSVVSPT